VCDSMPFYMNCGEKLPEGAESCPKCGTQVAAGSKPEKKDYSDIGGTLIMVGGVLKIVLPFLSLTFALLFWGTMIRRFVQIPEIWIRWGAELWISGVISEAFRLAMGLVIAGAVISIVLGILTIYVYNKVKGGDIKNGGVIAIPRNMEDENRQLPAVKPALWLTSASAWKTLTEGALLIFLCGCLFKIYF